MLKINLRKLLIVDWVKFLMRDEKTGVKDSRGQGFKGTD
jgi:hypothetical protein